MEYSQEKRGGLNHVRFADEELIKTQVLHGDCLLYTSDAADD